MELQSKIMQRIRILIVYSTEMNRQIYRVMFDDHDNLADCDITYTNTPHKALQVFTGFVEQRFPFDIVFLDYQLPTSNGIVLARKLKTVCPKTKFWFFESIHLKVEKIKKEYIDFFGFFREPITTYEQIAEIIARTKAKKQKLLNLRIHANAKK